ncbi:phage tail protein [Primorskyibacter flagellatus]|uniref:Microcystin-dependent protein n=1 Tax=Primorskyibacter flagellatus TaxID=1387277 RepID=A0A1W2AV46_9RHOB|nr:tail fiber protein [Primorskyibacter flagellatus]SMC64058.1 Microcystin-dependent protein [Primorskyibacter flagellatus]
MLKSLAIIAAAAGMMLTSAPGAALAGPDPYMGDIVMVGENYCPRGWAETNGQLMPISQYSALFSLLGTTYGGDGRTTFALPNLQSRVVVGMGQGAGLANIRQGQMGGVETVTITQAQLPNHTHVATSTASTVLNATNEGATEQSPEGAILAEGSGANYDSGAAVDATLRSDAATTTVSTTIGATGGSQPMTVVQPYVGMKFCIAITGAYPSRS